MEEKCGGQQHTSLIVCKGTKVSKFIQEKCSLPIIPFYSKILYYFVP